ncbi:hypothetical protein Tco_1375502 [Tanacetum coccineum]
MESRELLNVTFDESPPPTKLSPLVDDDVGEEEAIKRNTKVNVNPSCSTSNREFLDPKKKKEIDSLLEDSRIVDSLDGSDKIEYFVPSPP